MQHAVLVMKQLVLMHGVPSDVKVSSVVDETSIKESRDYESITARRFSWKIDPDSSTIPGEPRATDDSSGAHAPEVRNVSLDSCATFYADTCFFHLSFSTIFQIFSDVTDVIPKFCLVT